MKSHSATKLFWLVYLASAARCFSAAAQGQEGLRLHSGCPGLSFDMHTGTLAAMCHKLTGDTYQLHDDAFEVEAAECSASG